MSKTRTLCVAGFLSLSACQGDGDLPAGSLCAETAAAVAAQALACSGDIGVSGAKYDAFNAHYACAPLTQDNAYDCAGYLASTPCSAVLAPSLETLFKRAAPVCTQVLLNNPNDTQPVLAPGQAHAQGVFNNAVNNFDCTFGSQPVTSADANTVSVVANAQCTGGTFGFNLVFTGSGSPVFQSVVFPNFAGNNDAVISQQSVTFSAASVDPFGYFHATGTFALAASGTHVSYNLSGTMDFVLQPAML